MIENTRVVFKKTGVWITNAKKKASAMDIICLFERRDRAAGCFEYDKYEALKGEQKPDSKDFAKIIN